ncbi:hypothetical protein [Ectothiorhodospira lacustris]|uniref:hypothetical protein n=1 Tax=Ectothiorhodospira lacustris TaxID=2899127 RepID=UPI001EE880E2|nr:hypothetical protein [Ectothiorhodospira lacustris]MCG5502180.1 hypothetical protein [Ectothiorhodospira lacustris]MCG5511496.1 hypothetical protein [Ectothiorhodospira lacustris]MCG5523283.1 hypothetical protein [Ectothiorhodospira lacustris]
MTRDQQRLADYLAHITEAIERIDRYTGDMDRMAFLSNQLVQDERHSLENTDEPSSFAKHSAVAAAIFGIRPTR